jgi:hypothetical protein
MFELIGLAFAVFMLFALAAVGAVLFAAVAWILLRRQGQSAPRLPILSAALLPILCTVYFILFHFGFCAFVASAHESVFGDISEPLPNGYTLTGLAKMSDYSNIEGPTGEDRQPDLPADVGKLEVQDQFVFASISRPFGEPEQPHDERGFFVLDTMSGKVTRFDTLDQMQAFAGHPIHLMPSGSFGTQDHATLRIRRIRTVLLLGPPLFTLFLYAVYLIRLRSRLRSSENESPALA